MQATTTLVTQLDHLNLSVDTLEASEAWYGRVFGFRRVDGGLTDDGTPWAILRAGDALLCLYEHRDWTRLPNPQRRQRALHGVNHFALRITDRAAWEETVAREGLAIHYGGPIVWPHSTAWYVTDPTGYEIEVALWTGGAVRFD